MKKNEYLSGVKDAAPVGIGYFAVSFGFGALAASYGLRVIEAGLISLTNFTSAGQAAGLVVIASNAPMFEMILTQIVINSRYALMSLALSQKMGKNATFLSRFFLAFFNTDEIFALAMARKQAVTKQYVYGLATPTMIGWTGGTLTGAFASTIIPGEIRTALGVALYGMFIVIVIPQAKERKPILAVTVLAAALSGMFYWIPMLSQISKGLAIVICTVVAATICAILFPVDDEEEENGDMTQEDNNIAKDNQMPEKRINRINRNLGQGKEEF